MLLAFLVFPRLWLCWFSVKKIKKKIEFLSCFLQARQDLGRIALGCLTSKMCIFLHPMGTRRAHCAHRIGGCLRWIALWYAGQSHAHSGVLLFALSGYVVNQIEAVHDMGFRYSLDARWRSRWLWCSDNLRHLRFCLVIAHKKNFGLSSASNHFSFDW